MSGGEHKLNREAIQRVVGDSDIQVRMALTQEGQVTWARPDLGMKCVTCVHMVDRKERVVKGVKRDLARCYLVKVHTGRHGVEFNVGSAIACSQYKGES
jgi:hypothetical protein